MVHACSVETLIVFACNEETNNMAELIAFAETPWTILVLTYAVLAYNDDRVILDTYILLEGASTPQEDVMST